MWAFWKRNAPIYFFLMVSNIYERSVIIVEPIVESLEHWRQAKSLLKIGNQNKGDDSMKEKWVVFYHGDRELCAYTAYSFPLPNDKILYDQENPMLKHFYCCCGDCDLYGKDVTSLGLKKCDCFEEL